MISRNYTTIARISKDALREVFMEFPDFRKHLEQHVHKYKYKTSNFLLKMMGKIDYLRNL